MNQQLALADDQPAEPSRLLLSHQIRELLAAWNDAPAGPIEGPILTNPAQIADLMMASMRDLEQEELHVLLLDTKNRLLRDVSLYRGSISTVQVRLAEVFREAIRDNARCIVVCHNHPSGDANPSPEDVRMTRDLNAAGKLLDIDLLDHLVIGRDTYTSLRERGLGF